MSDYQARLNRHLDELRWLYYELYEHAPNRDAAFRDLLSKMEQASRDRRDGLKALDDQREQDPGWYKSNELLGCAFT